MPFESVTALLDEAQGRGVFPAAVIEVGRGRGVFWSHALGRLRTEPDAPPAMDDTVFDLASLTKVLATTSLAMVAVDKGLLALDDPVARWLPDWRGADRGGVTIRDLLEHASGLTAHLPFFRDHHGRADFERAICTLPLEYPPRTQSIYSDLGFILLGFILADAFTTPLDETFGQLVETSGWGGLTYRPPTRWRDRTAPTELDTWRGRLLVGEVHDENAWALGGVAGHSGLFGTAADVGAVARAVLAALRGDHTPLPVSVVRQFMTPSSVPGSSRALGWDTMRPTSSCGRLMSTSAIGHTGFTGTSLWIDPEADLYVVLLTNRVHPTRANELILQVRPAVHDAVMRVVTDRDRPT